MNGVVLGVVAIRTRGIASPTSWCRTPRTIRIAGRAATPALRRRRTQTAPFGHSSRRFDDTQRGRGSRPQVARMPLRPAKLTPPCQNERRPRGACRLTSSMPAKIPDNEGAAITLLAPLFLIAERRESDADGPMQAVEHPAADVGGLFSLSDRARAALLWP